MKIKKLTLQNYRYFENLDIDFHERLTVIVGNNGSGKTAILDSIATILSKSFNYLSTANQRFEKQGRGILDTDFRVYSPEITIQKKPVQKETNYQLSFDNPEFKSPDVVEVEPNYIRNDIPTLADLTYLKIETTKASWDIWSSPTQNRNKPETVIGEKELKDYLLDVIASYDQQRKLTPVFVYYDAGRANIENIERLKKGNINYNYPTAALINSLSINQNKDSLREALEWFDAVEATELRKEKEGNADYSSLETVRIAISKILGEEYSNPRFNSKHKFVVTKKLSGQDSIELSVKQLSQGYRSMLALAIDFSRRLSIANNHLQDKALDVPAIMLIDEVDLHLHPSWQQRVLSDLMNAFPNTQFIVTTHSPQVLSTIKKEHIRVLKDGELVELSDAIQTYGELSSDVLYTIMDVNPRPPIPERQDLDELTRLVDSGLYNDPKVREVLDKVIIELGENAEAVKRIKRSIERQQRFAELKERDK